MEFWEFKNSRKFPILGVGLPTFSGEYRMLKTKILLPFVSVWIFLGFVLGQTGPAGWKGRIVDENGIKTVKNPDQPLYGEFVFDLEKDLAIGGDPAKEEYYFPRGGAVNVDAEGNFYMADVGNTRVQMYDRTGKFIRTIGRKGQGPGEYGFPSRVFLDSEGNPFVWSGRNLIAYERDGLFKKKITIKAALNYSTLGPRGLILGALQPSGGPGGPRYRLVQIDAEGAPRTIAEYRGEFKESQRAIIMHAYSNRLAFETLTAETFVYGFSEEYKINLADADGRTILAIVKEEKPLSISGKEKSETQKSGVYAWIGTDDKTLNSDAFPEHRPFFGRFFTDDVGHIYVVRTGSILEKDAPQKIDVFSKEGYYLYRMSWASFPSVIKAGFLYEVREDKETNEFRIIRYRIKNWASMK